MFINVLLAPVPFEEHLQDVILFAFIICMNFYLIKSRIPILQIPIGVFSVVIGMMFNDLPLFPFLNLIIVIAGIVNILSSIETVTM